MERLEQQDTVDQLAENIQQSDNIMKLDDGILKEIEKQNQPVSANVSMNSLSNAVDNKNLTNKNIQFGYISKINMDKGKQQHMSQTQLYSEGMKDFDTTAYS